MALLVLSFVEGWTGRLNRSQPATVAPSAPHFGKLDPITTSHRPDNCLGSAPRPGRHAQTSLIAMLLLIAAALATGCDSTSSEQPQATAAAAQPTTASANATPTCPNSDQALYFLALSQVQGDIGTALAILGDKFIAAGETPTLITEQDWRQEVAVALATMDTAADQIRSLEPPPGAEEMHALQLQIATQLGAVTSTTTRGVDEIDPTLLGEAIDALTQINTLVAESTTVIERFCP